MYKNKKAFTLIELLVVIAIISVLAALLLPALEKALWQARLTACINNMRQQHFSLTLYYDDWNNHLPSPWPRDSVPQYLNDSWYAANRKLPMGLGVLCAYGYLPDTGPLLCPDNRPLSETSQSLLKQFNTTGEFNTLPTECTYIANTVNAPITVAGQGALIWDNKTDFYANLGIASRLEGNLPGGVLQRDTKIKHLRSPRSLVACGFPGFKDTSYNPHSMVCINALYADGVMAQCRYAEYPYLGDVTVRWYEKFKTCIDQAYPRYQPPN